MGILDIFEAILQPPTQGGASGRPSSGNRGGTSSRGVRLPSLEPLPKPGSGGVGDMMHSVVQIVAMREGFMGGMTSATSYPDLQKQPTQRVDTSDWFDQNRPSTTSQKQPQSSSNSGFGMEDVMTTPNERTSRPSTAPNAEAVTKQPVRKGDWSFDSNIETTPQPSAPKKQTNSDWGFEQVDQ